jgi:hypothetical protein
MDTSSLLGVWTGNVHNSNGWDMKLTLSILQPFEAGSTLGIFDIPLIPCSGTFRAVSIREHIIDLQMENQQGDCSRSDSDILEVLPDGTMKYISKGKGWEMRGVLHRIP